MTAIATIIERIAENKLLLRAIYFYFIHFIFIIYFIFLLIIMNTAEGSTKAECAGTLTAFQYTKF